MIALTVILGILVYAVGSTLTFGFFARRVDRHQYLFPYQGAAVAAIFWPFAALFLVPAKLYLEHILRKREAAELRAREEKELLRLAEEELALDDESEPRRKARARWS